MIDSAKVSFCVVVRQGEFWFSAENVADMPMVPRDREFVCFPYRKADGHLESLESRVTETVHIIGCDTVSIELDRIELGENLDISQVRQGMEAIGWLCDEIVMDGDDDSPDGDGE